VLSGRRISRDILGQALFQQWAEDDPDYLNMLDNIIHDPDGRKENVMPTERQRLEPVKCRRTWNDYLFDLLLYKATNNSFMVPVESGELGKWVGSQRNI
jgi:hypothetical protein